MENTVNQITEAVKRKDYHKLKSILKQSDTKTINDCFFETCSQQLDTAVLNEFLHHVNDINTRTENYETALHILSRSGNIIWLQHILSRKRHTKAKVDAKCLRRKTPLLLAAQHGHLDILKLLEQCGGDLHHCDAIEDSAAHLAAIEGRLDCLRYLIEEKNIRIDSKNKYGDTPLLHAAYAGQEQCVEYLLDQGANVLETDFNDQSALVKAAWRGHDKCVEQLIKHVFKHAASIETLSDTYEAGTVSKYINAQDKAENNALIWAATMGFEKIITRLLNFGANVNLQEKLGKTALNYAAGKGHEDIVRHLIKARASVDIQEQDKKTALMWAAIMGQSIVVKHLLKAKAKVDLQDMYGNTALIYAASKGQRIYPKNPENRGTWEYGKGHDTIAWLLVKGQAKVDIQSNDGQTALIWASKIGFCHVVRTLVEADPNVNLTDSLGETALMKAAKCGYLDVVVLLVDAGADVNLSNNKGQTACDLAKTAEIRRFLITL